MRTFVTNQNDKTRNQLYTSGYNQSSQLQGYRQFGTPFDNRRFGLPSDKRQISPPFNSRQFGQPPYNQYVCPPPSEKQFGPLPDNRQFVQPPDNRQLSTRSENKQLSAPPDRRIFHPQRLGQNIPTKLRGQIGSSDPFDNKQFCQTKEQKEFYLSLENESFYPPGKEQVKPHFHQSRTSQPVSGFIDHHKGKLRNG